MCMNLYVSTELYKSVIFSIWDKIIDLNLVPGCLAEQYVQMDPHPLNGRLPVVQTGI